MISGDLDATDADGLTRRQLLHDQDAGCQRHGGDRRRHRRLDVHACGCPDWFSSDSFTVTVTDDEAGLRINW